MPPPDRTHTTRLLRAAMDGDGGATDELLPFVYEQLREIARRLLRGAKASQTLQPTELIHEAYVRLGDAPDAAWESEQHFRRVAARAMRFVLVDRARARRADKRGGGHRHVTLETQWAEAASDSDQVLFVHDGLERLQAVDAQLAQIVELRFFAGLTLEETGKVLGMSHQGVHRAWLFARGWLHQRLTSDGAE